METKTCNKCAIEKTLDGFEYRKDKNSYRNTCKECRNKIKKENYDKNKDEINAKRRKSYAEHRQEHNEKRRKSYAEHRQEYNEKRKQKNTNPIYKLRNQIARTIDRSFERKGFKRNKSIEEILGCSVDEEVENLLFTYRSRYKKEWDGKVAVEIDHIIPLMMARTREEVQNLCSSGNLQLLTKEDNHIKGGRMSNGIGKNGKVKYEYYYDPEQYY